MKNVIGLLCYCSTCLRLARKTIKNVALVSLLLLILRIYLLTGNRHLICELPSYKCKGLERTPPLIYPVLEFYFKKKRNFLIQNFSQWKVTKTIYPIIISGSSAISYPFVNVKATNKYQNMIKRYQPKSHLSLHNEWDSLLNQNVMTLGLLRSIHYNKIMNQKIILVTLI